MSEAISKRTSTAATVASALGRKSKRIVFKWADAGLPHDRGMGRGGTRFLFDVDEVKSWLAKQGLDTVRAEEPTADLPFEPAVAVEDLAAYTREGRLDWDAIIAKATDKLGDVVTGRYSAQEKQRLTQAFRNASSELRALEDARHKSEERAGKFIARTRAEEVVAAEAVMFASDLDALATDLPRRIIADLDAGKVDLSDAAQVARVLAETVRRATDAIRRRRAESIRRALGHAFTDAPEPVTEAAVA